MLETRMTDMAAADAPADFDPLFTHAVMARIAARRAHVRLMQEGGAKMVKLEGNGTQADVVRYLASNGVPVCARSWLPRVTK